MLRGWREGAEGRGGQAAWEWEVEVELGRPGRAPGQVLLGRGRPRAR